VIYELDRVVQSCSNISELILKAKLQPSSPILSQPWCIFYQLDPLQVMFNHPLDPWYWKVKSALMILIFFFLLLHMCMLMMVSGPG